MGSSNDQSTVLDRFQGHVTSNSIRSLSASGNSIIHVGDNYNDRQTEHRCLVDLRTTDPRHDKMRIEQTMDGLPEDLYHRILENSNFKQWRTDQQNKLLWIQGNIGRDKTMLLCGIINELNPTTKLIDPGASELLSYFFCQGTDARVNNATAVLRGLIYLLASQQPSLILHIQEKYNSAGKNLFEDVNAWIALHEIFTNMLADLALKTTYLIIDALDECETDLLKLLKLITLSVPASPRIKWIVSSRNRDDIEQWLERIKPRTTLSLDAIKFITKVHNLQAWCAKVDGEFIKKATWQSVKNLEEELACIVPTFEPQKHYTFIVWRDLNAVILDDTKRTALHGDLSGWSKEFNASLPWRGGEDARRRYMDCAENAERLLGRHGLSIRKDIDKWYQSHSMLLADSLPRRDRVLMYGLQAAYFFDGNYQNGWSRAGMVIMTMSWLMELLAVQ